MTLFWIIGALVFGLCMFLMVRRSWKRAERIDSFKGKVAICPHMKGDVIKTPCGGNLAEDGNYKRDGLRGTLFDCWHCGGESWWDMELGEPRLREQGERGKRQRRRRK